MINLRAARSFAHRRTFVTVLSGIVTIGLVLPMFSFAESAVASQPPGGEPSKVASDAGSEEDVDPSAKPADAKRLRRTEPLRELSLPELPANASSRAAVARLTEIPSRRGAALRVYREDDGGAHVFQVFGGPVNFHDGEQWRPIDTTLEPAGDGFKARRHVIEPFFPSRLGPAAPHLDFGGSRIELTLENVRSSSGRVAGDRITYPDVLPRTDVRYVATRSGLAEHLILRDSTAPSVFDYEIRVNNLDLSQDMNGNIIMTRQDNQVGVIPLGFAEESADGVQAGGGDALRPVSFALSQAGPNRYRMTMSLDRGWLSSPDRVFPVLIDPDVVTQLDLEQEEPCNGRPPGAGDPEGDRSIKVSPHCFYRESYKDSYARSDMSSSDRWWWEPLVKVGRWDGIQSQAFFDFPTLSTAEGTNIIYKGSFRAHNYWSQGTSATPSTSLLRRVDLHRITTYWDEAGQNDGMWWGRRPNVAATDSYVVGCGANYEDQGCAPWHKWDITPILQRIQRQEAPDYLSSHGWRLSSPDSSQGWNSQKRYDSMEETKVCWCEPYLLVSANSKPGTPSLVAPANGTTINTDEPILKTNDVTDANGDDVYLKYEISADSSFSEFDEEDEDSETTDEHELYDSGWIRGTSHQVPDVFDPGATYHWRVRSWDRYSQVDGIDVIHPHATSDPSTFTIEGTPPSNPGSVTSPSHQKDVKYQDRTVNITWSASTDSGSGLHGYSWLFSEQATKPDLDSTIEGQSHVTATESGELDDGTYYFHIRAVDNVGNKSGVQTYGPILIGRDGVGPVATDLRAQSDFMGLEQYMPYDSHPLGNASAYVHLRGGNLVVQGDSLRVPAKGLNAVIRHTYNSGLADVNTGLGMGWSLSISDLDTGPLDATAGSVTALNPNSAFSIQQARNEAGQVIGSVLSFTDGDGTTHRFVRDVTQPDSRWHSPPGVGLRLREETDAAGNVKRYELVRPDGVSYQAEKCLPVQTSGDVCSDTNPTLPVGEWRITRILDRLGNRLDFKFAYVGLTAPQLRLDEVRHSPVGGGERRVLDVSYDSSTANVTEIRSLPDAATSTQRVVQYSINGGRLEGITERPGVQPRATGLGYDSEGRLSSFANPRQGTDSLNHISEFHYDAKGRMARFEDRRSAVEDANTSASDDRLDWRYTYRDFDSSNRRETALTSPLGHETTYLTSGRSTVGQRRLEGGNIIKISDPGNNAGRVVSEFTWDRNYLVSKKDGLGNTTTMGYNALGLVTLVESPRPTTGAVDGKRASGRVGSNFTYEGVAGSDYGPGRCAETDPSDLNCFDVAELVRTRSGRDFGSSNPDASSRVTDFYYKALGELKQITQRADPSQSRLCDGGACVATNDRTTLFDHYGFGGIKMINGPRDPAHIAGGLDDVTKFGVGCVNGEGYHHSGMPNCVEDAFSNEKTFTYNDYGMLLAEVDREGRSTVNDYDVYDNLESTTDPQGDVTTFEYDTNNNQVVMTSPRGTETSDDDDFESRRTFDALDRVTDVSTPGSSEESQRRKRTITYDDDGREVTEVSPAAAADDVSEAEATTTWTYWPNGQVRSISEPAGSDQYAVSDVEYDQAGRKVLVTFPITTAGGGRPRQRATYSPSGTLVQLEETSSTGQLDRITEFAYNSHAEQVEITGPRAVAGHRSKQENAYNAFGEVTRSRRLIRPEASSDENRWLTNASTYDTAGNQTSSTQPSAAAGDVDDLTSHYTFDALNQLVTQSDPINTDHMTRFSYWPEGNQRERLDMVDADSGSGRDWKKQRGVETDFNADLSLRKKVYVKYDSSELPSDRISFCAWRFGEDESSGYDPDGHLVFSRSVAGSCSESKLVRSESSTYDHGGFLETSTQVVDPTPSDGVDNHVSRTQDLSYRADGTLVRSDWTHGGVTTETSYSHSAGAFLERASHSELPGSPVTASYFPSGGAPTLTLTGVATASSSYHADGSLASLTWNRTSGSVVRKHSTLRYSVDGLLSSEEVLIERAVGSGDGGPSSTGVFTYDLTGRLSSWTSPFVRTGESSRRTHTYTLDDGGNIDLESISHGASTETIDPTYVDGRLTEQSVTVQGVSATTTFDYSKLGEEVRRVTGTDPALHRTYDPGGRTKTSDVGGSSGVVEYQYDANDRLVSRAKQSDASSKRLFFYFAGTAQLAEETDAGGTTKTLYFNASDGQAIAEKKGSVWAWLLRDPKGSVATRLVGGEVRSQTAYDPYGTQDLGGTSFKGNDAATESSKLGFQGSHTDEASGNLLLGPRIYDPKIDRFTTADYFVGASSDMQLGTDSLTGNRYLFAAANPVAFFEDGYSPSCGSEAAGCQASARYEPPTDAKRFGLAVLDILGAAHQSLKDLPSHAGGVLAHLREVSHKALVRGAGGLAQGVSLAYGMHQEHAKGRPLFESGFRVGVRWSAVWGGVKVGGKVCGKYSLAVGLACAFAGGVGGALYGDDLERRLFGEENLSFAQGLHEQPRAGAGSDDVCGEASVNSSACSNATGSEQFAADCFGDWWDCVRPKEPMLMYR